MMQFDDIAKTFRNKVVNMIEPKLVNIDYLLARTRMRITPNK